MLHLTRRTLATLLLLLVLGPVPMLKASKTFFTPRSISLDDSTFELALTNYDRYHGDNDDSWLNFYVKPFYQRSRKGCDLARYFLPNNQRCVTLSEDGTGDLDSLFFNLISPAGTFYNSTVCLSPRRTTYGAVFTFYANLDCLCDKLWLGINFAAMGAKHDLHVCETGSVAPGTLSGFTDACDAFNNPEWTAGRLACRSLKRSGVDDIQLKLGYDYCSNEDSHGTIYLVTSIPTGKRPRSCYLFEPIVGSKHGSLGLGFNGDYTFNVCDDHNLTLMGDIKYRYVFRATERRSFDLINGDWSRYLPLVSSATPVLLTPGINAFTLNAEVTPRSTINLWTAVHYDYCNWNFELGYNFWWRQAEKVCIKCPLASDIGILDLAGICSGTATSANAATIAQSIINNIALSDGTFTDLTTSLLNQNSAAHPRALSNKIYASIGYNTECYCHPILLGINGSYEFGHRCAALSQGAVWGTVGISY